MYEKNDPRALLAGSAAPAKVFTQYRPSDYQRFYAQAPQDASPLARTWLARGTAAVISYSEAESGAEFRRTAQPDEWALMLPDPDTEAVLTVGEETRVLSGFSLTFVPPGPSTLRLSRPGRVVRIFTARASDLAAAAGNAAAHATPDPNVLPWAPWPEPADGYRIRSYSMDVPEQPGRFGRIWRCTTLMINLFQPAMGPRDIRKLSPHHHDDFEQYSLALAGSFVHHLRWAWTPDMTMWRPDEAETCHTPSLAIIPSPAIHTSRGTGPGQNLLVDIFAPPRMDFSNIEGWVLNAADYPKP